jgi:hypothetical protein
LFVNFYKVKKRRSLRRGDRKGIIFCILKIRVFRRGDLRVIESRGREEAKKRKEVKRSKHSASIK